MKPRFPLCTAFAAVILVACGADTAPDSSLPPTMTYVLETANEHVPPALVYDVVRANDGEHTQIYVTADTVEVSSTGHYVQHAELSSYSNGVLAGRIHRVDHGSVTRSGTTLHLVSDYLQNVAFDADISGEATLVARQDLTGEGVTARYVLRGH